MHGVIDMPGNILFIFLVQVYAITFLVYTAPRPRILYLYFISSVCYI